MSVLMHVSIPRTHPIREVTAARGRHPIREVAAARGRNPGPAGTRARQPRITAAAAVTPPCRGGGVPAAPGLLPVPAVTPTCRGGYCRRVTAGRGSNPGL